VIFVNLRPGANHRAAIDSLNRIASQLTNNFNFGVFTGPPLRPAEIVNYRSLGTTPAVLGSALALGAVVALGLTLVASVRRRGRDLALLKTLGFTRRQLASVVAWQSSVAVIIGTIVGVPLGIVFGRLLWTVFANEIHAVPSPSVPAVSIVLVALGAIVLANVVAALPGHIAARTTTAQLLRAE
jgi:ABC-type lipoprotein release transport system permease subunit